MKVLSAFLLCLLCAPVALAQEKLVVEYRGNFGLHEVKDSIQWQKYVEDGDRLVLVGFKYLQIIDLPNTRVVETRPVKLPIDHKRSWYASEDWELCPDGRRMLIFGHPDALDGKRKLAWVWDLREGKRLAVLDHGPSDLRSGVWSKDGKSIVTSDRHFKYINGDEQAEWNHVFSFWDGETYEYRGSVTLENVMWWHLSDDGRRFFAAAGRTKRSVVGVKYVSDSAGTIGVWDTRTGRSERTIAVGDENFNPRTREIRVSPDGRFLVFTNKHKSNPAEHRLLAWELDDGGVRPAYELKPQPKIDDSGVVFSPDGRYFALDVGKNLQIYETRTGEKKYELADVELPRAWLNNEVILDVRAPLMYVREKSDKMFAVEVATGKVLYQHKLTFREEEHYTYVGDETEKVAIYTSVVPHPAGEMFMTFDYEYVRVFDTRTGELLQTVISPPVALDKTGKTVYDKDGKPKLKHGAAVKSAGWSRDGRALYVFSANGQSVSIYGLVEN